MTTESVVQIVNYQKTKQKIVRTSTNALECVSHHGETLYVKEAVKKQQVHICLEKLSSSSKKFVFLNILTIYKSYILNNKLTLDQVVV